MQPVITVKDLGKRYTLAHQRGGYVALRDVIAYTFSHPFAFLKTKKKEHSVQTTKEDFWALKDVSFDVQKGEVIGIIGKNGAGKSTLLKILTGITPPTEGEARLKGKVSSLLEVGTGFHPELTGRENIFLNGAILGMTRAEITKKFAEIVAFAGIEKFLDTPVKRYSSGMYVRLAFSVAAHLEPDILIVDEVLAVGDAEFQKKCLGKMEEVTKKDGRTILFVSHNMGAIERLCKKTLLIERGKVKMFGDTKDVIHEYLHGSTEGTESGEWKREDAKLDNPWCSAQRFAIADKDGRAITRAIRRDQEAWVRFEFDVQQIDPSLTVGYAIYSEEAETMFWSYQTDTDETQWPKLEVGRNVIQSKLPIELLNEGTYRVELIGGLHNRAWLFQPNQSSPAVFVTVSGGLSDSPLWTERRPGSFAPVYRWYNAD